MIKSAPIVGAPNWRLIHQGDYLVAVAGADEIWVVDDVPGTISDELAACWTDRPPTPDELSAPARLAVEQLRIVGVFGAPNVITAKPRLALHWSGPRVPSMIRDFSNLCRELNWSEPTSDPAEADLVIVLRTSAGLAETAELVAPLTRAGRIQLFCDLASARTIALGPFVVPGHTACIGCLAGRVTSRWGDPPPPVQPGGTAATAVTTAAGMLMHHVRRAIEGSFGLVDATVSLDLDSLQTRSSPCLRSAQCRYCADQIGDGRVELPWLR